MRAVVLAILFFLSCGVADASSFLSMDAPTLEFSVEGMEYKQDLDMFVQQKRKVWLPLGELWFWATAQYGETENIELVVETDDGETFSFLTADNGADFWVDGNHILVRFKIMHSDCFHGSHEVQQQEKPLP